METVFSQALIRDLTLQETHGVSFRAVLTLFLISWSVHGASCNNGRAARDQTQQRCVGGKTNLWDRKGKELVVDGRGGTSWSGV